MITKQILQKKEEHPSLASVREAVLAAAKAAKEAGRHDTIEITFPVAKHTVQEPFVLSAKENPELAHIDLTLSGTATEATSISSLTRLDGTKFVREEGEPYFTYKFKKPKGAPRPSVRDLFLNFKRIEVTSSEKWVNMDPLTPEERSGEKKRRGFYAPIALAKKLAAYPIGTTELVLYFEWEAVIFHVTGVDLKKTRMVDGEEMALLLIKKEEIDAFCTAAPKNLKLEKRIMFVKNAPALLCEKEDTFAFDAKTGTLYLNPKDKVHMWCHAIEYPACDTLFRIEGMKNVTFRNLTFTGVSSTYASDHLYYAGQANCPRGANLSGGVPRGRLFTAAILAGDVRNLTVEGCHFTDIGCNGIQVINRSLCTTVRNCVFKNVDMCAISLGNPTWHWEDESNRSFGACIENNYFEHIAYPYPTSPCLFVAQIDGLKILHNTIRDCAYSGISVGWCWSPARYYLGERCNIRDAEIAYNDIRDFMQLLRDGGAIYVLGGNANKDICQRPVNFMHDNYAEIKKSNVWDAKYGYYCDGASSNWQVSNSVILGCQRPLFSQSHPQSLSYHNHFIDIYSNTPNHLSAKNHGRDITTDGYHLVEGDVEALFAAYPQAQAIRDAAGCNLILP